MLGLLGGSGFLGFKGIDSVKIKGKTVVVRVDINSPIIDGKVKVSGRIRKHAETLKMLGEKGARVVVLAHQGRPGKADCVSLEQHVTALSELIGKEVYFSTWDEDYVSKIKALEEGSILLMDNVRLLEEEMTEISVEEHGAAEFVRKISEVADFFVLDGMSVAHRAQASVVGFSKHLPCYAGPVVLAETDAFDKGKKVRGKKILLLGGAKIKDSIKMIHHMLGEKQIDLVLCGGLVGDVFLKAAGIYFGAKEMFFKDLDDFSECENSAKELMKEFEKKIIVADDLAIEFNGERKEIPVSELPSDYQSKDIGSKTAEVFAKEIKDAKLVIWNGPLGVYEEEKFSLGTKLVAEAIAESKAYSVIGGGDTETAISAVGVDISKFNYISISGKAALNYLAGKELPGLSVLEKD